MSRVVPLKILSLPSLSAAHVWVGETHASPEIVGVISVLRADVSVWFLGICLGRTSHLVLWGLCVVPNLAFRRESPLPVHLICHPGLHFFQPLYLQGPRNSHMCSLHRAGVCRLSANRTPAPSPGRLPQSWSPAPELWRMAKQALPKTLHFPGVSFLVSYLGVSKPPPPIKHLSSPPHFPTNLSLTLIWGTETPTSHTPCPAFSLCWALF